MQLCIRAEGEQNVKPAIVFRGKENVRADENAEYDGGVDVCFQTCAWMDSEINMQWVAKTLVPGIGKSVEGKVIFADNVAFQQDKQFHNACRHEMNANCLGTILTRFNPLMLGLVKCTRQKSERR